jgi:tripartite-type tricarboxylate transporter receptor subunit TctC
MQKVQRAAPDGYTLGQAAGGLMEFVPAMQGVPFDPLKDFAYIASVAQTYTPLAVRGDLPINSLADYIAYAKSTKDGLTYGIQTLASPGAIMIQILKRQTNAPITIVPYQSEAAMTPDLLTGRVDSGSPSARAMGPALAEKKLKVIAVSSEVRAARFPDAPTAAEAGYPMANVTAWFGLFGPAGLPPAMVAKLNQEWVKAARDPELQQRLATADLTTDPITPAAFLARTEKNNATLTKLINEYGLKMQ